jgi:hypothetical protein
MAEMALGPTRFKGREKIIFATRYPRFRFDIVAACAENSSHRVDSEIERGTATIFNFNEKYFPGARADENSSGDRGSALNTCHGPQQRAIQLKRALWETMRLRHLDGPLLRAMTVMEMLVDN